MSCSQRVCIHVVAGVVWRSDGLPGFNDGLVWHRVNWRNTFGFRRARKWREQQDLSVGHSVKSAIALKPSSFRWSALDLPNRVGLQPIKRRSAWYCTESPDSILCLEWPPTQQIWIFSTCRVVKVWKAWSEKRFYIIHKTLRAMTYSQPIWVAGWHASGAIW